MKIIKVTLAEALKIISESDLDLKRGLYSDCVEMTVSDGFCARSEALLIIALHAVIVESGLNECSQLVSVLKSSFNIASSSVLYIESQYNKKVNESIVNNYRPIYREAQIAGFNFIYQQLFNTIRTQIST